MAGDAVERATEAFTRDLLPPKLDLAARVVAVYLPLFVIVGTFMDWGFVADSDPMFLSVVATASVVIWLILSSLGSAATTIVRLQNRGALPQQVDDAGRTHPDQATTDGALLLPSGPLGLARSYVTRPRWTWITIAVASFAGAGMYVLMWSEAHYRTGSRNPIWLSAMAHEFDWPSAVAIVAWIPVAAVVGAVFVRFVMMTRVIHLASYRWGIRPLVGHPDNAAGLKPLGDQLIRGFVICSAPAILVSVWVILLSGDDLNGDMQDLSDRWLSIFRFVLAPLLTVIAIAFALAPLRHVRKLILSANLLMYARVDRLARTIDEQALASIGSDDVDDLISGQGKVKALRGLYAELFPLPQWPFDRSGMLKIAGAVAPQVLTLVGLGSSVSNLVGNLVKSVQ